MAANPIYKFKAELMDTKLKIWREFEVANDIPMSRFGYIMMSMFNMAGGHLFRFEVPCAANFKICTGEHINAEENQKALKVIENSSPICYIEIPTPYDDFEPKYKTLDAKKTKLKNVLSEANETMFFNYDFGDDWQIKLTLENVYMDKATHGRNFPRVLAGEGLGIIEDCGGVGGLEDLDIAFQEKSGEQYEQYCEWLGRKELDLKRFNLEALNYVVKQATAIFKESYEL